MADREAPRVLLFGTRFPPSASGTAAYARGLALGLASQELEVHVLTMGPTAEEDGLPFPVRRLRPTAGAVRRYGRCLGALRRELERLRPDCLWTTNGMGTRVAGLIGPLACPLITCARGSDLGSRLPGRGPWRRLESLPLRRAYRRSAGVAAASLDMVRLAVSRGVEESRLFVSYPAFDFSGFPAEAGGPPGGPEAPPALLTVARLTRQKRVDVVLRAVAAAGSRLPGLRCTVVGDGPERGRLERLARELGLGGRVRFAGALPPRSAPLVAEYRRAAVFALTSVGEGLGNVYIEAGAFGLPSIGVDGGGTPEVVSHGHTGWLVPADDPAAAADRLVHLFSDHEARRRMGRAARRRVESEFSVETLGRRSAAVVRAVIAGGRPPCPDLAMSP